VTVAVLALVSLTAFVVAVLLAAHGSPRILVLRLEAHPVFTASALSGAALATAVVCWLLRRKRAARR
jgi:uncharacterized membrane protein